MSGSEHTKRVPPEKVLARKMLEEEMFTPDPKSPDFEAQCDEWAETRQPHMFREGDDAPIIWVPDHAVAVLMDACMSGSEARVVDPLELASIVASFRLTCLDHKDFKRFPSELPWRTDDMMALTFWATKAAMAGYVDPEVLSTALEALLPAAEAEHDRAVKEFGITPEQDAEIQQQVAVFFDNNFGTDFASEFGGN